MIGRSVQSMMQRIEAKLENWERRLLREEGAGDGTGELDPEERER